jgi:cation transport protein ChaC
MEEPAGNGRAAEDDAENDLWIFGYGSLMWRPGFRYRERQGAVLRGYRRRLCVLSHVHRGTPQRPGLVLGLDRGGAVRGITFRVGAAERAATIAYLRKREQATSVYIEAYHTVTLDDGRRVPALTYTVDRNHPQYLAEAEPRRLLALVRQGVGVSGANPDYILSTHRHLQEIGVEDPVLAWLADHLERPVA